MASRPVIRFAAVGPFQRSVAIYGHGLGRPLAKELGHKGRSDFLERRRRRGPLDVGRRRGPARDQHHDEGEPQRGDDPRGDG
ncbi:hypothetical protein [Streptomyces sp. NBC_00019]|uniref:hypothetical protein n=1 Tax=Streptomyces sp. NBC_00019 TaxID=2975623 RepID=UPI00324EC5A5